MHNIPLGKPKKTAKYVSDIGCFSWTMKCGDKKLWELTPPPYLKSDKFFLFYQ